MSDLSANLDLSVDDALSSIDRLGAALDQTAQQFSVALAQALEVLDQPIDVGVTVDAETEPLLAAIADVDDTAAVDVDVSGDTEQLALELDSLDVDPVVVDVSADTSEAQAELASLPDPPDVIVDVVVETGDAEAELEGITSSADGAGGSLAGLAIGSFALGEAFQSAEDGAGGLGEALSGLSGPAKAAVSGIAAVGAAGAALGAVGKQFFDAAIPAITATESFDRALGDLAVPLATISSSTEGVSTSVAQLAQDLGSSDEEVLQAVQGFGQLGIAAGDTASNIDSASEDIVKLAARARSLNPALGDLDSNVSGLARGLARGGRFLAQYGISLSAVEIETRALADTGKTSARELTQYEKSVAGAALAVEQLGGALDEDIAGGLDNASIRLGRFQQQFGDAIEDLGKPLVVPIFDILEAALPAALDLAQAAAEVVEALLPIAQVAIEAAGPLAELFSAVIIQAARDFAPLIERISGLFDRVLTDALEDAGPSFDRLITAFGDLAVVALDVFDAVEPLLELFLGGQLQQLTNYIAGLSEVISLLASIAQFAPVLALFGISDKDLNSVGRLADENGRLRDALFGTASAAGDVQGAITNLDNRFVDFLRSSSTFADDIQVERALERTGIASDTLLDQLSDLGDGFKDFVIDAQNAGEVQVQIDGVDATAAEIRGLGGDFRELVDSGRVVISQGSELTTAFRNQQGVLDDLAQSQYEAVVASAGYSDAVQQEIAAFAAAEFGADSYANRLRAIAVLQQEEAVQAAEALKLPLEEQAAAWLSLADAVVRGDVTTANFQTTAAGLPEQLGVSAEQIGGFVEVIDAAVRQIGDSLVTNLPSATQVLQEFKDVTDPQQIIDNLALQTLAIANFLNNQQLLLEEGRDDTVALLASLPSDQAAQLSQALLDAEPAIRDNFESALEGGQDAVTALEEFYRGPAAQAIASNDGALADLAKDGTDQYGLNLNFDEAAEQPVKDFSSYIVAQDQTSVAAGFAGLATGFSFGEGTAQGIRDSIPTAEEAARLLVQATERAAREEAESRSPSRLFAQIGEDLTAGLAKGLADGTDAVVREAERIVAAAARAVADQTITLDASVVAGAAGGGVVIQNLTVDVTAGPGVTTTEARAVGAAAMEGAIAAASRAQIRAVARAS